VDLVVLEDRDCQVSPRSHMGRISRRRGPR